MTTPEIDPAEPARVYTWNGNTFPISMPELSDMMMAGRVRMLMRDELRHEAVCCAARDRIMCLSAEKAALEAEVALLREALAAAKAEDNRDMFAAHALPATIKIAMKAEAFFEDEMTEAAKLAYQAADAMLVVRSEVEPEDSEESVLDFWVHE